LADYGYVSLRYYGEDGVEVIRRDADWHHRRAARCNRGTVTGPRRPGSSSTEGRGTSRPGWRQGLGLVRCWAASPPRASAVHRRWSPGDRRRRAWPRHVRRASPGTSRAQL